MKVKLIIGTLLILIFSSCESGYQKDNGKWIWVSYDEAVGKRISPIDNYDAESFKILENKNYATDRILVFYIGRVIQDADPKSFEVINSRGYSKDENHVYLDDEKIVFANPKTFELLEFPYSKDDNNVFCGTIPMNIQKKEVKEFKVTNENELMADGKSSILLSHFIEINSE